MNTENDKRLLWLSRLSLAATLFTLAVIALGALTRLMDAGLGCPDWPGCYGHLAVPSSVQALKSVNHLFPNRPVIAHKAWMEMAHRYFAGSLALLVTAVVVLAYRCRKVLPVKTTALTTVLLLVLLYQPLLGMWTVTLKLLPIVVTQHLMGGFSLLALLLAHYLIATPSRSMAVESDTLLRRMSVVALVLLGMQIFLGAWTSTNYAAIICDSFPMCQIQPWHWQFHEAFTFFKPIGVNYDGGQISVDAKRTIQVVHRFGALIVASYLFVFSALAVWRQQSNARFVRLVMLMAGLVLVQVCLGVANVLLARPLLIAVFHNLAAASLLISAVAVCVQLYLAKNRSSSR